MQSERLPRLGDGPGDAFDANHSERLGEGEQASVVAVRQRGLERSVAVKVCSQERLEQDPDMGALLLQEGCVLAQLAHPDVVGLLALAETARGEPVLAMERADGVTWTQLMADPAHPMWESHGEARSAAEAIPRLTSHLRILGRVCAAIEHVHQAGYLHRDIKPDNVIIGPLGRITLIDFGLAHTHTDAADRDMLEPTIGTPAYMAPELVEHSGGSPSTRVDVFSLGAILHEVVTGTTPYLRESAFATMVAAASNARETSYPDHLDEVLRGICEQATAFDPAQRYPSAVALRSALQDYGTRRTALLLLHDAREVAGQLAKATEAVGDDGESLFFLYRETVQRLEAVRQLWPDCPDVPPLERKATRRMARGALRQGDLDLADQLITALGEPKDLRGAWNAAMQTASEERRGFEDLERLVDDMRNIPGWGRQRRVISVIAVLIGLTVLLQAELQRLGTFSVGLADVWWTGGIWGLGGAVYVWRRWLGSTTNQVDRQLALLLLCLLVAGTLHWPMALALKLQLGMAMTLMLVWVAMFGAIAAFSLEPRFHLAWIVCALFGAVCGVLPAWQVHLFGAAFLSVAGVLQLQALRERGRQAL